jgi:hypothetical protein
MLPNQFNILAIIAKNRKTTNIVIATTRHLIYKSEKKNEVGMAVVVNERAVVVVVNVFVVVEVALWLLTISSWCNLRATNILFIRVRLALCCTNISTVVVGGAVKSFGAV